jgi:hypothetical protein
MTYFFERLAHTSLMETTIQPDVQVLDHWVAELAHQNERRESLLMFVLT